MAHIITDATLNKKPAIPVLIDFKQLSCGPCRTPIWISWQKKYMKMGLKIRCDGCVEENQIQRQLYHVDSNSSL